MAESVALLVDEVLPEQPIRQWVLSFPFPLRFLFASALNLNIHFHMLFLDGVYVDDGNGTRFRWVRAPTTAELTQLAQTIAQRVGRFLERQGLLERDAENSYLAGDAVDDDPLNQLLGHSITYRIAVGPQAGRKVFTLQTLPACEPEDRLGDTVGKVAGFSLHAGVAAKAHERKKLERLCRYISRPAVSERRLSLTSGEKVRYELKTPYRDGTTGRRSDMSFSSPWTSLQNWRRWCRSRESTSPVSTGCLPERRTVPTVNIVRW